MLRVNSRSVFHHRAGAHTSAFEGRYLASIGSFCCFGLARRLLVRRSMHWPDIVVKLIQCYILNRFTLFYYTLFTIR